MDDVDLVSQSSAEETRLRRCAGIWGMCRTEQQLGADRPQLRPRPPVNQSCQPASNFEDVLSYPDWLINRHLDRDSRPPHPPILNFDIFSMPYLNKHADGIAISHTNSKDTFGGYGRSLASAGPELHLWHHHQPYIRSKGVVTAICTLPSFNDAETLSLVQRALW